MFVLVTFRGGPFNGEQARVETLERIEPFFIDEERIAHVYVRDNEVDLVYDPKLSREFSAEYDEQVTKFEEQIGRSNLQFLKLLPQDQDLDLSDLDEEDAEDEL
jgi:outer membrane lipoprotein-sorting protein